jgi:hypothetical protein
VVSFAAEAPVQTLQLRPLLACPAKHAALAVRGHPPAVAEQGVDLKARQPTALPGDFRFHQSGQLHQ